MTVRDPRNIITPDAFEVAEDLLGTPLATPSRRLFALLIDLAVVGFITLVTSDFSMVLGLVAAVFFIRAGFKRTPMKGRVFGRAMRFSVGCLGVFIGLVTAAVWGIFGFNSGFGGNGDDDDFSDPAAVISMRMCWPPFEKRSRNTQPRRRWWRTRLSWKTDLKATWRPHGSRHSRSG